MLKQSKYIVGIGASAGGLESLERFFKNCPGDIGACYVIVQHLSTQYKSMMDDLINRYTNMPVHMIEDNQQVLPNEVYLIPAGKLVTLENDRFRLEDKPDNVFHLPIDVFFKSLANNFGSNAFGVVLSGTGTDGSRGAIEINASGGMVISQDPSDAKFDGMPNSLIATGIVDAVLKVERIPERIFQHIKHPISLVKAEMLKDVKTSVFDIQDDVKGILQILTDEVGIDFNEYKWATVSRRIERRMQVNQVKTLTKYRSILQKSNDEIIALRRELLIPVTSFFRDSEVYDKLITRVIPEVIADSNLNDGIRIWVAGNSTGEEAYSLAMLFLEALSALPNYVPLKIFATDINPESIDVASQGIYPESIIGELPDAFLKRYFTQVDDGRYAIIPEVRQCIVFAKHNLLTDPPFTKMNMVSCRNTLIYFKSAAQELAIQKLQYALKVKGVLLLGKSESLNVNTDKFDVIDSKCKLYKAKSRVVIRDIDTRGLKTKYKRASIEHRQTRDIHIGSKEAVSDALNYLNRAFLPLSILVNEAMEVIHVYGEPKGFLLVKQGATNNSLSHLLHETLSPVVTTLFYRVKKVKEEVHSEEAVFEINNEYFNMRLTGVPIKSADGISHYLLVINGETISTEEDQTITVQALNEDAEKRNNQLELELMATRESLQATIEELETTNEELQATNEELMASNEELQSSNEELQSVNEELNTVNSEYHEKMNVLNQINADLDAMGKATSIATIFVDEELCITRYTPDAKVVFRLREQDIERPLSDVSHDLLYENIYDDLAKVIASGTTLEREVMSKDGRYYLTRIVFYKLANQLQGAVISFIDITGARQSENLQLVIDALPEHIAVLSHSGEILMVNHAWTQFAKANGDDACTATGVGANYLDACLSGDENEDAQKAYYNVKRVLEGSVQRSFMEYPCHSPTEQRWFAMETIAINHGVFAAVVSHFNISAWKLKMEQSNEQ